MPDAIDLPDDGAAAPGSRPPPEPNVAFLLIALGRSTVTAVEDALRPLKLSYRQFSVLGHVRAEPGISFTELARRAGVTMQSMHVTASRLESQGLVRRTAAGRGRRADLELTEAGMQRLADSLAAVRKVDWRLLAALPEAEQQVVRRALLALFLDHER